jgi:hypothetical protein
MKYRFAAIVFSLLTATAVFAEEPAFPGLKAAMDPESYARSGVGNLSPDQRAALDEFLRGYVAGKQKDAATVAAAEAVDRAVKERKVSAPDVIESRIVGDFTGAGHRTVYALANGQVWRPTDPDDIHHSPISNPAVVLYRDTFGYKMFVEGAGMLRVKRVR